MQIGQFTSTGKGYAGTLATLTLNVELTLEPGRSERPNAPNFVVFRGIQEIGYAYNKTSEGGIEYIAVKIDDPSLPYPIYASLFQNSKSDTLPLVWNRRKAK